MRKKQEIFYRDKNLILYTKKASVWEAFLLLIIKLITKRVFTVYLRRFRIFTIFDLLANTFIF